jgi:MEMO1 family protein
MVRQPAVAGAFYPAEKSRLVAMLERFLSEGAPLEGVVAVVSPHAGYPYSGAAAGAVFALVEVPATIVIMGPNHRGIGAAYGVYDKGSWRTPLGDVPIDEKFAAALLKEEKFLTADTASHMYEHSIEVQVPFLQYRRPDAKIVPICIGDHDLGRLVALGSAIARAAKALSIEPLVVASSDMSHYESAASAARKDRMAIERMLALDEEGLWEVVRRHEITMCGVAPAVAAIVAGRELGAREAKLVKYTNSGETTGDMNEVVGYASVAFMKSENE